MKKGFTLIELVVVLIIVAILGTLGLTNFSRMIEKSRGAEAKEVIGNLRKLAAAYYMEQGSVGTATSTYLTDYLTLGTALDQTPGTASTACRSSHYFWYNYVPATTSVTFTATRCIGATGKPPGGVSALTATLATNLSTGVDTWGGTGGY